ncbi:DUF4194 domain-containing protein [Pseudarthrobacter sp. MDT3-26]|uniref:DUF4194 domain-containing protein n=1 Tax=Pseudarthrobacter raffinosi TaxID=2953651 RepID=UPI00208FF747|nr:DUF4194 domain-containing protein [Pseudarthrobacter sp. MDT3-26]MCO4261472.1 DUF4194 domain-containing protein [Pseudarthrobacter sp. MDT3-26]
MSESGVPGPAGGEGPESDVALWGGEGTLREPSRRVLVQLLRGPYLSASRHGNLWTALLSDEDAVRSRLADLFLDLVTDHAAQVAFVRNTSADVDAPTVMRTATLTFLDTALLLHLRQALLQESGGRKTIIGADEAADQLQVYRGKDNADITGFSKRINSSWQKMVKYGLLAATSTEGRFEVSPVLRLVFGTEEIAAVQAEYQRLAAEAEPGSAELPDTGEETE